MPQRPTTKILLSLAALGTAAGLAGLGTFASFTSSTSASQTVASGTVTIAFGDGEANRLTTEASGLVPGDSLQRRVQLTNSGSEDLESIKLTTVATTSSVLDTDTTNGLQMKVERCALGWTESAGTPYTYTCGGTPTTVLDTRPVIGADLTLSDMVALTGGTQATDDLVFTVSLPTAADNTFQAKSSTIQYTFNATQRAGTAK